MGFQHGSDALVKYWQIQESAVNKQEMVKPRGERMKDKDLAEAVVGSIGDGCVVTVGWIGKQTSLAKLAEVWLGFRLGFRIGRPCRNL